MLFGRLGCESSPCEEDGSHLSVLARRGLLCRPDSRSSLKCSQSLLKVNSVSYKKCNRSTICAYRVIPESH